MSRTFTNLLIHLIFSTKHREPMIVPEIESELHRYFGGLTRDLKGKAYGINGTCDHVHIPVSLPPVIPCLTVGLFEGQLVGLGA